MKTIHLVFLSAACGMLSISANAAVYAHYSFDSDYTDDSGNGRDGTLTDVGTTGNSGITSTAGEFVFGGGAMNFSSDRDYIAIPSKTFSSGIPYTIAFWAKKLPDNTGAFDKWDMVVGERGNTNFFIALNNPDKQNPGEGLAGLRWRSANSNANRQADFDAPNDNLWHHHVITAQGTNISYYLDGSLVATDSGNSTGFIIDTIGDAYTGGADIDFHGQIDEVWVFDETLDATAVSNLYAFNATVPEPSAPALLGALLSLGLIRRRRRG